MLCFMETRSGGLGLNGGELYVFTTLLTLNGTHSIKSVNTQGTV